MHEIGRVAQNWGPATPFPAQHETTTEWNTYGNLMFGFASVWHWLLDLHTNPAFGCHM